MRSSPSALLPRGTLADRERHRKGGRLGRSQGVAHLHRIRNPNPASSGRIEALRSHRCVRRTDPHMPMSIPGQRLQLQVPLRGDHHRPILFDRPALGRSSLEWQSGGIVLQQRTVSQMFIVLRPHCSALGRSMPTFAVAAAGPSDILASPDCSHVGADPWAECVVKLDEGKTTIIVHALAVLEGRLIREEQHVHQRHRACDLHRREDMQGTSCRHRPEQGARAFEADRRVQRRRLRQGRSAVTSALAASAPAYVDRTSEIGRAGVERFRRKGFDDACGPSVHSGWRGDERRLPSGRLGSLRPRRLHRRSRLLEPKLWAEPASRDSPLQRDAAPRRLPMARRPARRPGEGLPPAPALKLEMASTENAPSDRTCGLDKARA